MAVSAPPPPVLDAGTKVSVRLPHVGALPGTVDKVKDDRIDVVLAVPDVRAKRLLGSEGSIESTSRRGIQRWPVQLDQVSSDGVLALRLSGEGVKIQRREWARVDAALKVFVNVLDDPKLGGGETMSLNLSGGGLLIRDEWRLPLGVDVRLAIMTGDSGEQAVRALGRVVRDAGNEKKGIRFEDISREDAERLIRFIRERERAALRVAKDHL